MFKSTFRANLLAVSLLTFTSTTYADIAFNGFATITAGRTLSTDESLYDYEDSISFQQGSLFALQASSDLGEGFGVTAQIIARGSDDWDPNFEWAYVSYDVSDEWRLLFGRQRAPQKLYSDYVDVGYAYPWITPPKGLYSPSFDSYDGIGSIYNFSMGSFDSVFHVMYGHSSDNPFGDSVDFIEIDDFVIGALTITKGILTARVSAATRNIYISLPSVDGSIVKNWHALAEHPQLSQTGVDFIGIGNAVAVEDKSTFVSAALKADFEHGFAVMEWESNDYNDNFLGKTNNWYISSGVNIDNWVVFVTYGSNETEVDNLSVPDQAAGLGLDALIAGTKFVLSGQVKDEKYYSVGTRWDFHSSAALKLELTKFDDNQVNPYNPADVETDATVMRVALVTVF